MIITLDGVLALLAGLYCAWQVDQLGLTDPVAVEAVQSGLWDRTPVAARWSS